MNTKKGERVRWYLFANSNEDDVHTPHWHGQTVVFNNMRTDMVHLEPMMMVQADMVPDNVGTCLFHCHVNDHIEGGMQALFRVLPDSGGEDPIAEAEGYVDPYTSTCRSPFHHKLGY
jgi:FtsP/CotA-like multicopper oxidase with cupredoxin domain